MTLDALLRLLVRSLHASETSFMLTGSVAAAYHGAARATMNVDAVIDPTPEQLADLVHRLELAGLYVSSEAAREALAERTMFNAIDPATGWKVISSFAGVAHSAWRSSRAGYRRSCLASTLELRPSRTSSCPRSNG